MMRENVLSKLGFESLKSIMERIGAYGKDDQTVPFWDAEKASGISRVFGSSAAEKVREELKAVFTECGMRTSIDGAGNVHGILSCGLENAPEVVIASHYDTVVHGGLYDGLLGVAAGAWIAKTLSEDVSKRRRMDLHVIATNGEEGNELGGTFGSRAMMGMLPLDDSAWLSKAEKYGYTRQMLEGARMETARCAAYLELHIEQGPTLYKHAQKVGVVTGIVGLRRYKVTVSGSTNHSGTTMMEDRDDALVKAARLIAAANDLAVDIGRNLVETVSVLEVLPGAAAVIPGGVEYIMEIRDEDKAVMDLFMRKFTELSRQYKGISIAEVVSKDPVKCDHRLQKVLLESCEVLGLPYRSMPSGATHDGNAMATKMPVAMLFVPSRDGRSHCKEEWTDWEDCCTGANVLYNAAEKIVTV